MKTDGIDYRLRTFREHKIIFRLFGGIYMKHFMKDIAKAMADYVSYMDRIGR